MYPYNCIGLIWASHSGKKYQATGSLLSSNIVLTAAHTMLTVEKDSKIRKIEPDQVVFYPQACGELKPGKESMVTDYRICSKYQEMVPRESELLKEKRKLKRVENLTIAQEEQLELVRSQLK
jgi:hypothetical protein